MTLHDVPYSHLIGNSNEYIFKCRYNKVQKNKFKRIKKKTQSLNEFKLNKKTREVAKWKTE